MKKSSYLLIILLFSSQALAFPIPSLAVLTVVASQIGDRAVPVVSKIAAVATPERVEKVKKWGKNTLWLAAETAQNAVITKMVIKGINKLLGEDEKRQKREQERSEMKQALIEFNKNMKEKNAVT